MSVAFSARARRTAASKRALGDRLAGEREQDPAHRARAVARGRQPCGGQAVAGGEAERRRADDGDDDDDDCAHGSARSRAPRAVGHDAHVDAREQLHDPLGERRRAAGRGRAPARARPSARRSSRARAATSATAPATSSDSSTSRCAPSTEASWRSAASERSSSSAGLAAGRLDPQEVERRRRGAGPSATRGARAAARPGTARRARAAARRPPAAPRPRCSPRAHRRAR